MFLLDLKQGCNAAGSGEFLSNSPLRWEVRFRGNCCEWCTVFLKPFFDHGSSEALVHPRLAGVALVAAAVGLPLMFARLPWLLALSDEGLFPLLCFVANCSAWLGFFVWVVDAACSLPSR